MLESPLPRLTLEQEKNISALSSQGEYGNNIRAFWATANEVRELEFATKLESVTSSGSRSYLGASTREGATPYVHRIYQLGSNVREQLALS